MDSLFLIVEIASLGLIIYWVGWPLVSRNFKATQARWWEDELAGLGEMDKEAVLTTLNEIEFDYSTGKLSEDDYHALKKKYQLMAVEYLEEEEEDIVSLDGDENNRAGGEKATKAIDKEIEEELKRLKTGRGNS